jgi:hypothetical protein
MLKFPKTPLKQQDNAKEMAISALSLLISYEEQLMNFFNVTGIDPSQIRASMNDTAFLAGVLDYFLSDEKLLLVFCAEENIKPESVAKAAHDLGGGIWERETA